MIRYILLLGLLLYTFFTIAQPNPNMSNNKEYFDRLYRHGINLVNLSPALPNDFGNTISWNMMQLTNLYEATHDKAYLVQLIHLSANAIINRFDVKNNSPLSTILQF